MEKFTIPKDHGSKDFCKESIYGGRVLQWARDFKSNIIDYFEYNRAYIEFNKNGKLPDFDDEYYEIYEEEITDSFGTRIIKKANLKSGLIYDEIGDMRKYSEYIGNIVEQLDSGLNITTKNYEPIDFMVSLDANSLYPSSMYSGSYPIGTPSILTDEDLDIVNNQTESKNVYRWLKSKGPHFIVEVSVKLPKVRFGYWPYRNYDKSVIYPSNMTINGVYNDIDLFEMVRDGAVIEYVTRGIYFRRSNRIFSSLIKQLYDRRKVYKSYESKDHPNHSEYPKENIIKIAMNSMYGKFNEKIGSANVFYDKESIQLARESRVVDQISLPNGQVEAKIKFMHTNVKKPIHIAGYITAYSRRLMNEIIRKVSPENVYYSDTDSIYISYSSYINYNMNSNENGDLCGYKNDYGNNVLITEAKFIDIKRYFLVLYDRNKNVISYKSKFNGLSFSDLKNMRNYVYAENGQIHENEIYLDDKTIEERIGIMRELYQCLLDRADYRHDMNMDYIFINKYMFDGQIINAIAHNKKVRNWEKENLAMLMMTFERFTKTGMNVHIEKKDMKYQIDPYKRGDWQYGKYFALGYNSNDDYNRKDYVHKYIGKSYSMDELNNEFVYMSYIGQSRTINSAKKEFQYTIDNKDNMVSLNIKRPLILAKSDIEHFSEDQCIIGNKVDKVICLKESAINIGNFRSNVYSACWDNNGEMVNGYVYVDFRTFPKKNNITNVRHRLNMVNGESTGIDMVGTNKYGDIVEIQTIYELKPFGLGEELDIYSTKLIRPILAITETDEVKMSLGENMIEFSELKRIINSIDKMLLDKTKTLIIQNITTN
jgi:hypothetical protein